MALYLGCCLEIMPTLPASSVDLILCDLPYGTTACAWDTVIPFEPLWAQYRRIAKPSAAIVLTASQPFTSALVMSAVKLFRYEWIWQKSHATGHLNSKKMPLKQHETVLVFYDKLPTYNPQFTEPKHPPGGPRGGGSEVYRQFEGEERREKSAVAFPRSIQPFNSYDATRGFHPTQKPVPLFEYFIRTYTNEGDTVLDNCMGSGTTGVAALKNNRHFIGIERDPAYFEIAKNRIGVKNAWPWS